MGYCYVKVHERGKEVLVAICDEELLGKTITVGDIVIEVKPEFYRGERVEVSRIHEYIERGTVINLIGNNVVKEAAKRNKILMDAAVEFNGILHVQIVK